MGFSLKSLGKKLFDQVNPFDGGKTWSNPEGIPDALRGTRTEAAVRQGLRIRNPGGGTSRANFNRIDTNPINTYGEAFGRAPAQLFNTGKAALGGLYGINKAGVQSVFGNRQGAYNTLLGTQETMRKDLSPGSGLFGVGTPFKNAEEAANIGIKDFAIKAASTGAQVAPYLLSPGGKAAVSALVKQGVPVSKAIARVLTKTAATEVPLNAAASAGQQYQDTGKIDPKQLAISTALSTAVGVGTSGAGALRGAKVAGKGSGTPVKKLVSHEGAPDRARVEFYKKQIQETGKTKPLITIKEGRKLGVEDGKHRLQAYKELGYDRVPTTAQTPRPKVAAKQPVPLEVTNKSTARGEFQRGITDKDAQIINYLKRAEKDTGKTGLVDQFYYDSGLQRRSNAIANAEIQQSPDIKSAFKGLKGKAKREFDDYVLARNEKTYSQKGLKTSRSVEDTDAIIAAGNAKYGQRFEALNRFYQKQADKLHDAGIIDDATWKTWKQAKDFTSIDRVREDLAQSGGRGNQYALGSTFTSKRRIGSRRGAQPSEASAFSYAQTAQQEIQKNQTGTNLIDVLSSQGHARKLTPDELASSKNTMSIFRNGQKEVYEVPKDIRELVDNISPFQLGVLGRIVAAPQRLLRAGATGLSAPFTAANYVKDQLSSAVLGKNARATHTLPNIVAGAWQASKDFGIGSNDALWNKFMRHLGDTTQYDFLRNVKNAKQLSREVRLGQGGRAINKGMHLVRTLEDLNTITEKATRFQNFKGIYKKVLKETGSEAEATRQATLAAWQNSVDFSRMGHVTQALNLLIPYFNAGVQGTRLLGRRLAEAPVATSAKTIGLVGLPLAGVTLYNQSTAETKAVYDNISDYEKENNFIIVLPGAHQLEDGSYEGVIKIPLQRGLSNLTQPIRLAIENYANKNPQDVGEMAKEFLGAASGPIETSTALGAVGSVVPQVAKPLVQQAMNKDFFTGKPIVPDFVEQATNASGEPVSESQKAFKYTSGSARGIGGALGVSPIRVEKFIKDTSGKVGQYAQNAIDNVLAKAGIIPDEQIGGISVPQDFVRRFARAQGEYNFQKSEGAKYFDDRKAAIASLNGNERAAFDALHPSKTNFLGEDIFDENKRITNYTRAGVYLQFPKVFEADKAVDAAQRAKGKPGNPLYDLTKGQLTRVLLKATLPPGAKDPELSNLWKEDWYQDFNTKRSAYYEQVKQSLAKEGKSLPQSDYPQTPPDLQKAMDAYSALPKGTGARSDWIRANPSLWGRMTNQWAATDAWENKERVKIGLSPIKEEASSGSGYGYGSKGDIGEFGSKYKYAVSGSNVRITRPTIKAKKAKVAQVKGKSTPKVKVSIRKSLV